jgi:hypothetical protein
MPSLHVETLLSSFKDPDPQSLIHTPQLPQHRSRTTPLVSSINTNSKAQPRTPKARLRSTEVLTISKAPKFHRAIGCSSYSHCGSAPRETAFRAEIRGLKWHEVH